MPLPRRSRGRSTVTPSSRTCSASRARRSRDAAPGPRGVTSPRRSSSSASSNCRRRRRAAAGRGVQVVFGHDRPLYKAGRVSDWTRSSDHAPYHDAGVPFVCFGVPDLADYHRPSDTADKITARFLGEVGNLVVALSYASWTSGPAVLHTREQVTGMPVDDLADGPAMRPPPAPSSSARPGTCPMAGAHVARPGIECPAPPASRSGRPRFAPSAQYDAPGRADRSIGPVTGES
jgi:hypothetical protein